MDSKQDDLWSQWIWPKRVLRRSMAGVFGLADTGWFGLTPLRKHIHICGYPRSGTTVLQMMLEFALPDARRFGREIRGWRAAIYTWRNHELVVSKNPGDLVTLHQLRRLYRERKADLRSIVLVRDLRDLFTSFHSKKPGEYYLDVETWRRYDEGLRRLEPGPDVLVQRYEDMVSKPAETQERLQAFIGESFERPLSEFHTEERSDFDTSALNGIRPLETASVERWRRPEHRERLAEVLRLAPEIPHRLVDLGYEEDASWVEHLESSPV